MTKFFYYKTAAVTLILDLKLWIASCFKILLHQTFE